MEEEPPTEEVPAEVVGQAKQDLGETTEETDEMERNVGFAKPQVSPPRVFTSHNNSECSRWSRRDVEDLRVMILDMQVDPSEYPESDSDQDQA